MSRTHAALANILVARQPAARTTVEDAVLRGVVVAAGLSMPVWLTVGTLIYLFN